MAAPLAALLAAPLPPPPALAALAAAALLAAAAAWVAVSFALGVARYRRLPLPAPPARSLLLGHASPMMSDRSPVTMSEWVNTYGPMLKLRVLGGTLVILTDPAAITRINRLPGTTKPDMYRAFDLPGAKHPTVFTDSGSAYWKAVRSTVAPCFSMTSLKRTFPWLLALCQAGVAELEAGAGAGPVDVADLAARITSDTIGDMLFSKDLGGMSKRGTAPDPDYIALIKVYLNAVHGRINDPLAALRFGGRARAWAAAFAAWDGAMEGIAREVMATAPPEYTIAGHLLRAVNPDTGRPLTLAELKGELSIFYIAGFETTSHAITWTLGLLAAHPAAQAALAAELAAAGLAPAAPGGRRPRPFEWGDLGRLPLLAATIKEAMRLFQPEAMRLFQPAAGGSLRQLGADTEVRGVVLPKGTMVAQPFFALGRSPANWGHDAREFKPQRWLPGGANGGANGVANGKAKGGGGGGRDTDGEADQGEGAEAAPAAAGEAAGLTDAMPFSTGPRDCVGRALATLELQAVLATLVGHFTFLLPPGPGAAGEEGALNGGGSGGGGQEGARNGGGGGGGGAAAGGVAAMDALVCYHITLFARHGMPLIVEPRYSAAAA
ncbi:MAG: cytochrome P450 [Monoraphidium minutum]|nr:MAG: cytochrome P450 [Monoraphidium minutum]